MSVLNKIKCLCLTFINLYSIYIVHKMFERELDILKIYLLEGMTETGQSE